MKDLFYIVETSPNWYNLRTTTDHYTLSFGSNLNTLLSVVYRYCVTFKTRERFLKRLREFDDKGLPPKTTAEYYKKQYEERGHLYDDLISEQVEKAMEYLKENTPYKRVRKKRTPLVKTHTEVRREETVTPTVVLHKRKGLKKITRLA